MNTHIHHTEDSLLHEHRLACVQGGGEAQNQNNAPQAGVPENKDAGAEVPGDNPEQAGKERVDKADKGSKKAKAAVDDMAEKLGKKVEEGADEIGTKEEAMGKIKTDLLTLLQEGPTAKKMPNSAEIIKNQIMQKLEQNMKNVVFDAANSQKFIKQAKVEVELLLRSNPTVVRETTAEDAKNNVESPLTPEELEGAKKLLGDDMLKQMKEYLAKDNTEMQQSLTKLWLGAQGFSVDDAVKDFKPENLTLANTHRMNGTGKLVNMAILAFTCLKLLKGAGERIGKSVEEGIAKATGEKNKPADANKAPLEAPVASEVPEVAVKKKIDDFNASQNGIEISLIEEFTQDENAEHKSELHIKPIALADAEFLNKTLDRHKELNNDPTKTVTNDDGSRSAVIAMEHIDALITLLSGNGRQKEELAQNQGLLPEQDGTYTKFGYGGKYTILDNLTIHWSGGEHPNGKILGPQIFQNNKWTRDAMPLAPDLDNPAALSQYLNTELARAGNVPAGRREEIVNALEGLAQTTDKNAKDLREELQLAPSKQETVNKITLQKAQLRETQSLVIRKTIEDIKKIKV